MGLNVNKPNGEWHPEFVFQATSPLEREELKSKGGGKKTMHYNRK